jgi:predicted  nucleic acid-binding Zn-ribbon protein
VSVQRKPSDSHPSDLEITAELPVLDVAASESAELEERLSSTDSWSVPIMPPPGQRGDGALEIQLRALAEQLRDVEERLRVKGARLIELENEIDELRIDRKASAERALAAEEALRAVAASGPSAQVLARQVEERDVSLASLQRELASAEARASAHLEALHTLENRRGIWDLLLRGLDQQVDERDTRLIAVEAELTRRTTLASELQADLAARVQRIAALEHEVAALAAALAQRDESLRGIESSSTTRLTTERSEHARHARELDSQIAAQADAIAALQGELTTALARAQELEGDLRAAEDAIHRLEGELRNKSSRLDELTKSSEEWRITAEGARRALEEREIRISRLEAEAASSAALVGTIKQSLQRLEPLAQGPADPAPEGATRLLVRATGDSEVVHVLGRRTTVGRTPDNDLQIDAHYISRHHAVILAGPIHTIVEDLNSTNGVRVNGRRVTRQQLKDGDVVLIGKTRFRFAVRQSRNA